VNKDIPIPALIPGLNDEFEDSEQSTADQTAVRATVLDILDRRAQMLDGFAIASERSLRNSCLYLAPLDVVQGSDNRFGSMVGSSILPKAARQQLQPCGVQLHVTDMMHELCSEFVVLSRGIRSDPLLRQYRC
jgi:hypothetical protein